MRLSVLAGFSTALLIGTPLLGFSAESDPGDGAFRSAIADTVSTVDVKPSEAQREAVLNTMKHFFELREGGRFTEAHALLQESNQREQPLEKFIESNRKFNETSGPLLGRRILQVSWDKDPVRAPYPGLYASVDFSNRFENIDRQCGYLVLYQPPAGGEFKVMMELNTYMDNATALKIEQEHSKDYVDQTWNKLSSACPNYDHQVMAQVPLQEDPQARGSLGYKTVSEALAALEARPGLTTQNQGGWTVIMDAAAFTMWSFTPPGHYAHPAVVRRVIKQNPAGEVVIEMTALCQADKASCDQLIREFQQLNTRMAEAIRRAPQPRPSPQ